jgi:hypothetical protein
MKRIFSILFYATLTFLARLLGGVCDFNPLHTLGRRHTTWRALRRSPRWSRASRWSVQWTNRSDLFSLSNINAAHVLWRCISFLSFGSDWWLFI